MTHLPHTHETHLLQHSMSTPLTWNFYNGYPKRAMFDKVFQTHDVHPCYIHIYLFPRFFRPYILIQFIKYILPLSSCKNIKNATKILVKDVVNFTSPPKKTRSIQNLYLFGGMGWCFFTFPVATSPSSLGGKSRSCQSEGAQVAWSTWEIRSRTMELWKSLGAFYRLLGLAVFWDVFFLDLF